MRDNNQNKLRVNDFCRLKTLVIFKELLENHLILHCLQSCELVKKSELQPERSLGALLLVLNLGPIVDDYVLVASLLEMLNPCQRSIRIVNLFAQAVWKKNLAVNSPGGVFVKLHRKYVFFIFVPQPKYLWDSALILKLNEGLNLLVLDIDYVNFLVAHQICTFSLRLTFLEHFNLLNHSLQLNFERPLLLLL